LDDGEFCSIAADQIRGFVIAASERCEDEDVSIWVAMTREIVKRCPQLPLGQFGFTDRDLDEWERTGYQAEYAKLKTKIADDAPYKDVSGDIAKARHWLRQMGADGGDNESFLREKMAQGSASVVRERNSCHTKTMISKLGKSRDQGDIGWCYAYAVADLISAKIGARVSAVDLAILNNTPNDFAKIWHEMWRIKQSDQGGGLESVVANLVKQRGWVCSESDLRSDDENNRPTISSIRNLESDTPVNCDRAVHNLAPNVASQAMLEIVSAVNIADRIGALDTAACMHKIDVAKLQFATQEAPFTSVPDMLSTLDQQLDANNVVEIGYNDKFLQNLKSSEYGGHASTIAGRFFNEATGECEYMIHNTWGTGCDAYDRGLRCVNGNIFVPKSVLQKNLERVMYIP
jgi:hypothetical protein